MPDFRPAAFVLLLALTPPRAIATEPEAPAAATGPAVLVPAAEPAAAPRVVAPAGIELVFEMGASLSSKTSQRGDRFPLRLAEPLRIDGQLLVPAGTPAMGEVVHADRARASGQAGELILAARYLEWDGRQLPLKAFRAGVGKDRTSTSAGVILALGVAGYLVRGGELELTQGSLIAAKLRDPADLPALPESAVEEASALPAAPDAAATSDAAAASDATATPATPATPDATATTEAPATPDAPEETKTSDTIDSNPGENKE